LRPRRDTHRGRASEVTKEAPDLRAPGFELSLPLRKHGAGSCCASGDEAARWPSTSCTSRSSRGARGAASRGRRRTGRASVSATSGEIVLPSELAGRTDTSWARERAALWNAAEHGTRRTARLAREVLVTLPPSSARHSARSSRARSRGSSRTDTGARVAPALLAPAEVDLSRAARVALALSALRRIGGGISARYAEIYLPGRAKPIRPWGCVGLRSSMLLNLLADAALCVFRIASDSR
jgi:hypothetical protein